MFSIVFDGSLSALPTLKYKFLFSFADDLEAGGREERNFAASRKDETGK